MEVSSGIKFKHFLFWVSTPLHLSVTEARTLYPSSIRRCCSAGLYVRSFCSKGAVSRDRGDYIQCSKVGSRYCKKATRFSLISKESFTSKYGDNELNTHVKLSSHIVARCDLVGTGSLDAAYPVSDVQLASKVRGGLFYAVTSVAAIILFNLMLLAHPFVLLFDRYRRKAHHFVARTWALTTIRPFFKVEIEGLENLPASDTPAVYVSNHQSFLDIYTLLTLGRSFKFISKTAIFLIPIIGWAMYLLGVIPLRRMDSKSQLECLKRCMDLIKKGASVFFFPEGTRSKDGKLGVFKKGAFSIAAKCGIPVIPITLIGTGDIMPAGKESILNPGSVKVIIHKSIEGKSAEVLCNEARNVIASGLNHQG